MSIEVDAIVIYDSILFNRGHMVRRWADALERRYTRNAIDEAPINKRARKSHLSQYPVGALKASITGGVDRIGPRHLQTTISVNVPYALAVIKGTQGPIYAKTANYLKLPRNAGHGMRTRFNSVPGQNANNFLMRAHTATAVRHPSIRGLENQVFQEW